VLRRELGKDAKPGAIRQGDDPRGAAVFVYVLGHESTGDDEQALKRARRARVPIVAVVAGHASNDVSIPFVLATDVVRVGAGEGFPVDAITRAIASRLGEDGAPLASRVPVLRGPVCDVLVASFARRCGVLAVAVFVPGADLPVLALNQVRMVLRLEQAYGLDADPRERAPEVLATVAAGLGLRALARLALGALLLGLRSGRARGRLRGVSRGRGHPVGLLPAVASAACAAATFLRGARLSVVGRLARGLLDGRYFKVRG